MLSDSILDKIRVYFKLHPDHWQAWLDGDFSCCENCKYLTPAYPTKLWRIGCKKRYAMMVDIKLTQLFFGDVRVNKECKCAEWIKYV